MRGLSLAAAAASALGAAFLAGCPVPAASPGAPAPAPEAAPEEAIAPPAPDGPALTEAEARVLLSDAFRAAGFRIRQDVRLQEPGLDVTLDGFDPDRGVGYEYVAVEERGTDLSDDERRLLAERYPGVLVLDAMPAATLEERVRAFLAAR